MSDQSIKSPDERIAALKNELAITKAELNDLQNSRSFRIVRFMRELSSARPSEMLTILKKAPSLIHKIDPPKTPSLSNDRNFSSAHNPLPLMRHPNITVATVGKSIGRLFYDTCNQMELGGLQFKTALQYNAVQAVVIDTAHYNNTAHYKATLEALEVGAKLIIIEHKEHEIHADFTAIENKTVIKSEDILHFIDIYNLDITPPQPDAYVKSDDFIIIDKEISHKDRASINREIASSKLAVVIGKPLEWVSSEVKVLDKKDELAQFAEELSSSYRAEQYALSCSRDTILNFNNLVACEYILIKSSLIKSKSRQPSIGIILATRRPENLRQVLEQLNDQTLKPAQVALLLHGFSDKEYKKALKIIDKNPLNITPTLIDSKVIFGEVLNIGLNILKTDLVSKIDDDDYYQPNHLLDLYTAHLHSRADFVGKWNNWVYLVSEDITINWVNESSNRYVKHLPGGTFLVSRAILNNLKFGIVSRAIDSELYRRAERRGVILYSTHRYNYVRKRDKDHTYAATNADFKSRAHPLQVDGLPLREKLSL